MKTLGRFLILAATSALAAALVAPAYAHEPPNLLS
jgi:hypothetical protein